MSARKPWHGRRGRANPRFHDSFQIFERVRLSSDLTRDQLLRHGSAEFVRNEQEAVSSNGLQYGPIAFGADPWQ
jgi:hypothetical protein